MLFSCPTNFAPVAYMDRDSQQGKVVLSVHTYKFQRQPLQHSINLFQLFGIAARNSDHFDPYKYDSMHA